MCWECVQTPKIGDVPLGGIGSSLNFTEDSTLGPEPLIWNSPNRYGNNGMGNKVPSSFTHFVCMVVFMAQRNIITITVILCNQFMRSTVRALSCFCHCHV